jgi:hypothetical protein
MAQENKENPARSSYSREEKGRRLADSIDNEITGILVPDPRGKVAP